MPGRHELPESAQEQPRNHVHPRLDNDKSPQGKCVEMGLGRAIPAEGADHAVQHALPRQKAIGKRNMRVQHGIECTASYRSAQ